MVTSPAKAAAATVKRRKKLGVDMGKLVAELQRQPKFEHRLRKTSKLHPRDFPARALMTGAVHELEHTEDPLIAVEIAMDHLTERTDYYRRLHRAIPNAGANKSDVKIPKDWADELYAWGEFSPASQSVGESAAKGERVDPIRARLAVEELRELAKTMQDKRLARMANILRGKLENRIFEHELGIAEENPGVPKAKLREGPKVKPFSVDDWRFDVSGTELRAHKPRPKPDEALAGDYSVAYPIRDAAHARTVAKAWVAATRRGKLPAPRATFGKLKGARSNTEVICTPCGPMVCPSGKKGGRCKPLAAGKPNKGAMVKAKSNGRLGLQHIEPTRGRWQALDGSTYATYYGSGIYGIAEKKGGSWSGRLVQGTVSPKSVSKVVHANNAMALQSKLEDMAERRLERIEGRKR